MKDVIEKICLIFVIISIIGFIISLAINSVITFTFSALSMLGFWAIAMIDISRKS